MKVAMMQPTFLPWAGYFELISRADHFVFLDDFQFVYRSFGHRNKLFTNKGQVGWYTIPIDKKRSYRQPYTKAYIKEELSWRESMWENIENNYKKSPYYSCLATKIENTIMDAEPVLSEFNIKFIKLICDILRYKTEFSYASQMEVKGKRSESLLNILRFTHADTYLSAHGSFEYMYEDKVFPVSDIEVVFQNHIPIPYKQERGVNNKFISYLSVLDLLFNVGPEEAKTLIERGTLEWLSWEEMKRLYIK